MPKPEPEFNSELNFEVISEPELELRRGSRARV